jgi:serine/threonine protein phosphatase PrpC
MPRIYLNVAQRQYYQSLTMPLPARRSSLLARFFRSLRHWSKRLALLCLIPFFFGAGPVLAAAPGGGAAGDPADYVESRLDAVEQRVDDVDGRLKWAIGIVLVIVSGTAIVVGTLHVAPLVAQRVERPARDLADFFRRLSFKPCPATTPGQTPPRPAPSAKPWAPPAPITPIARPPAPAVPSPQVAIPPLAIIPAKPQPAVASLAATARQGISPKRGVAGAVSRRGNVRHENQDCAVAFSIRNCHVAIVADGMGGMPYGDRAAHIATSKSAMRILEAYAMAAVEGLDPATIAYQAAAAAQRAIQLESQREPALQGGFRTTLIIAILDGARLGWAHIGDGGGAVIHSKPDGRITLEHFVRPHKQCPGDNAVAASLGPELDGFPRFGTTPVKPGDICLIGTDGVLDYDWLRSDFRGVKGNDLGIAISEALDEFHGDIRAALTAVVDDLLEQRDGYGRYIIDDNTSLAAIRVPLCPAAGLSRDAAA